MAIPRFFGRHPHDRETAAGNDGAERASLHALPAPGPSHDGRGDGTISHVRIFRDGDTPTLPPRLPVVVIDTHEFGATVRTAG